MGMCKECKEVFSALEMRNGLCKGCMSEEELETLPNKEKLKPSSEIIYHTEEEKKKSSFWGGKYNRVDFLLRSLIPTLLFLTISYLLIDYSMVTDIFIILLLSLAFISFMWGVIKRGRDIGLAPLRTLVLVFALFPFYVLLINFDVFYDYIGGLILFSFLIFILIFTLFFLLISSSKKEEIITSKFEKIGLSLLLIGLFIFNFIVLFEDF